MLKSILSKFAGLISIIVISLLLLSYFAGEISPDLFWPISFFGLAYPVIFLVFIIHLVIQLLFKNWFWVIVMVAVLFGTLPLHKNYFSLPIDLEKISSDTLIKPIKILSYNVRLFDLYNPNLEEGKENRDSIYSFLESQNVDVICFQEFFHQDRPTNFPTRDTLIQFLETKNYHERYSQRVSGRQNFGIAIFTRFPVISKGDIMFEDPENNDNNYCIFVDVVKGMDTFRVYNVHLQSIKFQQDDYAIFGENVIHSVGVSKSSVMGLTKKLKFAFSSRAGQANRLVEHIQQSPYPVIVCGDFNDTPASYSYRKLSNLLTDSFVNTSYGIGNTYAGKVPAGRIDYIFHSKELHSAEFQIHNEKVLSDHYAISTKIWK